MVEQQRRRVIVYSDAKNEADDQYAIAHALLSPSLDVRGLIPAHFGTWRGDDSMLQSRAEMDLLVELMGLSVRIENGHPRSVTGPDDESTSPGAQLIIEEAMAEAESPLYIACLGPLTDVALALLAEPRIAQRDVKVVWIGGESLRNDVTYYPEFNLGNDIESANIVYDSGIEIWQIPVEVFGKFVVTYAELDARVAPHGRLGRYLMDQLKEFNQQYPTAMEYRVLGDQPAIMAVMVPDSYTYRMVPAPRFGHDGAYRPSTDPRRHSIRLITDMDTRFTFEDLFHKLAGFAAS